MSGTSSSDKTRHEVLKLVVPGEYFGELGTILLFIDSVSAIRLTAFVFFCVTALLSTNDRAATATVEKGGAFILALAKEDFDTHMGSLATELSRTAKDEYGVAVVGGDRCVYYFNPRMGTFNPRMGTGN
jgi:cGMP-dependent protein kinase